MPLPHQAHSRTRPWSAAFWLACGPILAACEPDPNDSTALPPDSTPVEDTALTSPLIQDLAIEISAAVPTVARVRWVSEVAAVGSVRFGTPGSLEDQTPATPEGTEHEVDLLGLLPDTDYAFQVTATAGEESATSAPVGFHTGIWPETPPALTLSSYDAQASAGGFTIIPIQGQQTCWTTILDEQARAVWAQPIACGTHRARLALDGSGIVSHTQTGANDTVHIRLVSFFGEPLMDLQVPDAHHDFTIVDDHTYAVLGHTVRSFDDGDETLRLVGDTIIEVDTAGQTRVVWDLFDHLEPSLEGVSAPSDWEPDAWDWSHCNYLQYVPAEDAYYVTSRSLDAVFKVDRTTGAHLWTLADNQGDFTHPPGEAMVRLPHSVEPIPGGLLLFNQSSPVNPGCSEAVEVLLDEVAGTASRGWSYSTDDCLAVNYLGSAWPMDNGDVLAVFSQSGQMDEVTPDGRVVHRANASMGWTLSYAEQVASLYVAQTAP